MSPQAGSFYIQQMLPMPNRQWKSLLRGAQIHRFRPLRNAENVKAEFTIESRQTQVKIGLDGPKSSLALASDVADAKPD